MSHLFFYAPKLRFPGFTLRSFELTILCGIVFGSLQPILAQSPEDARATDPNLTFWVGVGLGAGVISEGDSDDSNQSGALSGTLYASVRSGPHLVSGRLGSAGEIFGDAVDDFGVLYGRALHGEDGFASIAAGIAGVSGYHVDDDDGPQFFCGLFEDCEIVRPDKFSTIGLPLEIQLMWRPFRYVGLGMYAFANFNSKASFAGATLTVQLGRLH